MKKIFTSRSWRATKYKSSRPVCKDCSCFRPAKIWQATRRDEFQLQKRKSITCSPRRGKRRRRGSASRGGARSGAPGGSGAECEERPRSPAPRRRCRRRRAGVSPAPQLQRARETAETGTPRSSAPAAATAGVARPAGESCPRPGRGARRGADVTSPPPPPPRGRERGKRQRVAAAAGRNSSTRRLAARARPDKLGCSRALAPGPRSGPAHSLFAPVWCLSLPWSEASGDAAAWVPAARTMAVWLGTC